MLTQEQVLEAVRAKRTHQRGACEFLEARDYARLTEFFDPAQWGVFGFKLKEGATPEPPQPWTEENILKQLRSDLEFAFEKAHGQRGISANLMYEVIKMWMWVLEDELQHDNHYYNYGLPYLEQVAAKYNMTDLITK